MTTLDTPSKDPRRLSFGSHPRSSFGRAHQSPYTPRSNRPSVSRLSGASSLQSHATPGAVEPSEEAENFVAGGLRSELRGVSSRAVSVARAAFSSHDAQTVALNYVAQISQELDNLHALSLSLGAAPSIRPSTRNQISILRSHLQLEVDSWAILTAAWNIHQPVASDLITRRLQLPIADIHELSAVPGVSKLQHAIAWLERKAAAALTQAGGPSVNPLDDPAYRWAYTVSRLGGKSVPADYPLLTDEDPLDDIERKAETRLAREVFRLVRAGMLTEAEQVCRDAGQAWRAAALAGGKAATALSATGTAGVARTVWRKAAAAIASSTKVTIPAHERAVCALLSGMLEPVLAVCPTYEDQLWARLCVAYDGVINDKLSKSQGCGIEDDAFLQIFRECEFSAEGVASVDPEVLVVFHRVQSYLVLGPNMSPTHLSALMQCLVALAKVAVDHGAEWACRLAAQICLFLKYDECLSQCDSQDVEIAHFDLVMQLYVQLVIRSGHGAEDDLFDRQDMEERASMCAIAASYLSEMSDMSTAISVYSGLLHSALRGDLMQEMVESRRAKVTTSSVEERRVLCLDEAMHCFEQQVAKQLLIAAVDDVWQEHFDYAEGGSGVGVSSEGGVGNEFAERKVGKDELVIRSIEFLMFSRCPNYDVALERTVTAIRRFFLLQKRETARKLTVWFPEDIVAEVSAETCGGFLRELQCWKEYFEAVSCFDEWYNFKMGNQPPAVPDSVRRAALAEPVQREAREKLEVYKQCMAEYVSGCEQRRSEAETSLYRALVTARDKCVPWMSDVRNYINTDGVMQVSENESRESELSEVKRCAIPEMVSLLHTLFDKSEMHKEATELAILVAGGDEGMFKHFGGSAMKAFLKRVAESAVKMADEAVNNGARCPYVGTFFEDFDTPRERPKVSFGGNRYV